MHFLFVGESLCYFRTICEFVRIGVFHVTDTLWSSENDEVLVGADKMFMLADAAVGVGRHGMGTCLDPLKMTLQSMMSDGTLSSTRNQDQLMHMAPSSSKGHPIPAKHRCVKLVLSFCSGFCVRQYRKNVEYFTVFCCNQG